MSLTEFPLQKYLEEHSSEENQLLKKINRYTNANVLMPRMISGHLQGRVLAAFSKMIKPASILEIGTYTGYSALCLAEGLLPDGKLITIDINEELADVVNQFFQESSFKNQIEYKIGNALQILPQIENEFDLVFIDADKGNYSTYFDLVFDKVKKGGFIIADNVLWDGKVTAIREQMDKDTRVIDDFNKKIRNDKRVEKVIFPVRDGLLVIRKI